MMANVSQFPHAALTSVGRVREHNEDAILAVPPLYIVADGLGGHEAGEIASNLAIEKIQAYAPKRPDAAALMRAVHRANETVIRAVEEGVGKPGMGTTVTAAIIADGKVVIAQVGDSRAYLLRSGRLAQMTEDHSVVAAMVRSGSLSPAEARRHPQRNVVTRALGGDTNLVVDTYEFETLRGDRWLLCSDGLFGLVANEAIETVLNTNADPRGCAEELIRMANEAGGSDNISAIVVDIDNEHIPARMHREHRRERSAFLWGGLLLIALVLGGTFYGLINYAQNRAYIATGPTGKVAIYRGVPNDVFGKKISVLSEESTIPLDSLPALDQQLVASQDLTFDSVESARKEIERLAALAPGPELNSVEPTSTEENSFIDPTLQDEIPVTPSNGAQTPNPNPPSNP